MCRALCRFDSGVVASFDAFLVPGAVANVPLFQLTGTVGEITIDGLGRVRLFDGTDLQGTVVGQGNYLQSYEGEMADFEAAVLDGRPPAAPAEYALGELRGALAMYRSAEAGTLGAGVGLTFDFTGVDGARHRRHPRDRSGDRARVRRRRRERDDHRDARATRRRTTTSTSRRSRTGGAA